MTLGYIAMDNADNQFYIYQWNSTNFTYLSSITTILLGYSVKLFQDNNLTYCLRSNGYQV